MENFTDTLNSDVFQIVKRLYAEQLLVLFDHPVLIKEMLSLEAERKAKDKILVRAPVRRGAQRPLPVIHWLVRATPLRRQPVVRLEYRTHRQVDDGLCPRQ